MNELKEDLDKLFEKHGVKRSLVLAEYKEGFNNGLPFRVLALGEKEDGECDFATLFEGCVNISKGFRDILEHAGQHSINRMAEDIGKMLKHKPGGEDRLVN